MIVKNLEEAKQVAKRRAASFDVEQCISTVKYRKNTYMICTREVYNLMGGKLGLKCIFWVDIEGKINKETKGKQK